MVGNLNSALKSGKLGDKAGFNRKAAQNVVRIVTDGSPMEVNLQYFALGVLLINETLIFRQFKLFQPSLSVFGWEVGEPAKIHVICFCLVQSGDPNQQNKTPTSFCVIFGQYKLQPVNTCPHPLRLVAWGFRFSLLVAFSAPVS